MNISFMNIFTTPYKIITIKRFILLIVFLYSLQNLSRISYNSISDDGAKKVLMTVFT